MRHGYIMRCDPLLYFYTTSNSFENIISLLIRIQPEYSNTKKTIEILIVRRDNSTTHQVR